MKHKWRKQRVYGAFVHSGVMVQLFAVSADPEYTKFSFMDRESSLAIVPIL
jgi:hypothetical protein